MSETEKAVVALWRKGRTSQDIARETGIPLYRVRAILADLAAIL
jgi:DNA-binding CsgD family transcriptional regulator